MSNQQLPRIRVKIVGNHPWAENLGWIEPQDGGYKTIRVLGKPPTMYKVKLDNGQECYAASLHVRQLKTERSQPVIQEVDHLP